MQISVEQLNAYIQFNGDRDGLSRSALPRDRIRTLDGAWPTLDQLRLDISNLKGGNLSVAASARVERLARDRLPGEEGFRLFYGFA